MKKILVIDDDPAVQSLTIRTLRTRGFETIAAADGLQGLELARKHLPDLIICDIQMPNLDGYGTLTALQEGAVTATIPFIFLTGLSDREQIRQGMGLGADDYVTKPFTAGELIAAVNARLTKQAAVVRRSEKKLEDLRGNIGLALPHELLTPLNGIIGFTSLMMDDGVVLTPEEVRDFARNISVSAHRLHRLIENFIIYSEVEVVASDPGKVAELRGVGSIPTAEAIQRAAHAKAEAARREGDLSVTVSEAPVTMLTTYFRKATEELIDNAFKFSKAGTPVRVASGPAGGRFVLSVTDQGRGMTMAQIADVGAHMQFERRFYEQQGVGLGLIVAKRLADLHDGDLVIESVPGKGTSVRWILPLGGTTGQPAAIR
jgi:two-component system sensor histidine kinase/response regulator